MYRLSGITALLALCALTGQAQAPRVTLGIKGGSAFSSGIGADARDSRLLLGGSGGGLVRVPLLREFALQAEVQYQQRGDNSTNTGTAIGYRLGYVAVPLLLHYHRSDGLFFEAGATLSRQLTATPNAEYPPVVGKPVLRSSDVGFMAGLGYQDTSGVAVG